MNSNTLGPWTLGLVNAVSEASIPSNGCSVANNVNIDATGVVTRRKSWRLLDETHARDIFEYAGDVYAVLDNVLGLIKPEEFTAIATVSGPVSYTVVNDKLYYADSNRVASLRGGGLYVSIKLTLSPMPGGKFLNYWQGRLVVARGNSLVFSEPLSYGVTDKMRGSVSLGERIHWLAPLHSGIFVGTKRGVKFLAGSAPSEFNVKLVANKSFPGAAAVVDAKYIDEKFSHSSDVVAVWMSDVGFAIGLPDGSVVYPQATSLAGIPTRPGRLVVENDRIFCFYDQGASYEA